MSQPCPVYESQGFCPICQNPVTFVAYNSWFRDFFICSVCKSVPRERALIAALDIYAPNWRDLIIHECSPSEKGASKMLSQQCHQYIPSQYFPGQPGGSFYEGDRCENLESLTFADESIDIHISQDVLEHVLRPTMAFREIARTLKPGGMHIFTVPLVKKNQPSSPRVKVNGDSFECIETPEYHSNPVGNGKSLVTYDWGFDICKHIHESCGLFTHILRSDDISRGIRADLIEVLVTVKSLA